MKSILNVFRHGLQRTKTSLLRRVQGVFSKDSAWDDADFEELEAALISTDLGVDISLQIVENVRDRYGRGLLSTTADIMAVAREQIVEILGETRDEPIRFADAPPTVVLLVGVNGSGKTTTAAKLAYQLKNDGKSVMLAAADTFRAAGSEQLRIWGERVACPVVTGKQGGDAAAVAYDAVKAAGKRKSDVVIVDTAGRQHTRQGLMNELEKIRRTVAKALPGAPHEVWLTIDGSTGTNALFQAREFGKRCEVTGLILTKLDGTGKGGVTVAIRRELGYPVCFVGLGEKMDDLQPFDAEMFAKALFEQ